MNRFTRAAEALGVRLPNNFRVKLAKTLVLMLSLTGLSFPLMTDAATLSTASVGLSDPRPSATSVNYTFTGSSVTSAPIQCVKAVFSTTATGDTAPTGWSGATGSVTAASSTLVNSSATGWSLATSDGTSSTGQKNIWQYTHPTTSVTPSTLAGATFIMAGITNSSTADTAYYLKISTFNNVDCATSPVDNATVEFINTNGSLLSLTVDDTLTFTVNGITTAGTCSDGATHPGADSTATTIPFGTVVSGSVYQECQDLQAASNSTNGYTIYLRYDHKPQNALSQTIGDWTGTNAAPTTPFTATNTGADGQGAYGYTTDDATLGTGTANRFTSGGQHYAAATTSNAEVGYEPNGVSTTHYDVTHAIDITNTTKPGTYTNTIIYTCTPVY